MNVYNSEADVQSVREACALCRWCDACVSDAKSGEFSTLDLGTKCKGFEKSRKRRKDKDNDRDRHDDRDGEDCSASQGCA